MDEKKKHMKLMDRLQEEGKQYYSDEYLISAHQHCSTNEFEVLASDICVCLYCGYSFSPKAKKNELTLMKVREHEERTVLCLMCSIDSVIGDASGFPILDKFFIARFTRYWWNGYSRIDYGEEIEKIKWIGVEVE